MALKPLNHWIIHNDELAQQLDETLRFTPFYNPVRLAPSDMALKLYVPLSGNISPLAGGAVTFARNSEGVYRAALNGVLAIASDDVSRHEYTAQSGTLGYLAEFSITNKCENWNANPDLALSNINLIGDPAAVFSRVQDVEELQAAGLGNICTSGYVLKLDNSAGVSGAEIQFEGQTGNLNPHAISAWARIDSASTGQVEVKPTGQAGTDVTETHYERIVVKFTPTDTAQNVAFNCQAGGIGYLILNQLEETYAPTSPIVTLGGAASRSTDQLSYALSDGETPFLNQNEGMHAIIWHPQFLQDDIPSGVTQRITSTTTALLFFQNFGPTGEFRARSGSSTDIEIDLPQPLAPQDYVIAMRWNGTAWTIGTKTQGTWYWADMQSTFSGISENDLLVISDFIEGFHSGAANCRKLALWDQDLGQQALENFYARDAN